MTPGRKLSRRSFLARVAGGSALAGGALVFVSGRAEAYQCTDRDTGSYADRGGEGRHCGSPGSRSGGAYTGVTDADSSDPENGGRRRRSGCSDNDRGRGSDPGGWGVRCHAATGYTDNDSSDPENGGRGYRNRQCSDSDSGSYADNSGEGRHC